MNKLIVLALLLTGCCQETPETDINKMPYFTKIYDEEYGVVCYMSRGDPSFSCVKVKQYE